MFSEVECKLKQSEYLLRKNRQLRLLSDNLKSQIELYRSQNRLEELLVSYQIPMRSYILARIGKSYESVAQLNELQSLYQEFSFSDHGLFEVLSRTIDVFRNEKITGVSELDQKFIDGYFKDFRYVTQLRKVVFDYALIPWIKQYERETSDCKWRREIFQAMWEERDFGFLPSDKKIIEIKKEAFSNKLWQSTDQGFLFIIPKLTRNNFITVFISEVQYFEGFKDFIDSFFEKRNEELFGSPNEICNSGLVRDLSKDFLDFLSIKQIPLNEGLDILCEIESRYVNSYLQNCRDLSMIRFTI